MALSFGLAKKVVESGPYNYGIALPLICAFYVANTQDVSLFIGPHELGKGLTAFIHCAAISVLYTLSLFMFILAGALSPMASESIGAKILVGIFAVLSLVSLFSSDQSQGIGLVFGGMAVLYLLLSRFDEGRLSTVITTLTGVSIAIFCGTIGLLWIFDRFLFSDAIAYALGLKSIDPSTSHLGGAALIATAYVTFYSLFSVSEA